MLRIILALLSLLLPLPLLAQWLSTGFQEPGVGGLRLLLSEDGRHWASLPFAVVQPEVGPSAGRVMRDPSLCQGGDGTWHTVWTTNWRGSRGFGHAASKDLCTWGGQQYVEVMGDTTTVNVWAPEVTWVAEGGYYLITWASCVPGAFADGAEAHDNNQRLYYTTTTDWLRFTPARLYLEPGFSCIDACTVRIGKGRWAVVFKDNSRAVRALRVCTGPSAVGPWSKPTEVLTPHLSEGPTVAKVGEEWLIYYDYYGGHVYGALSTRNWEHYRDATDRVRFPDGHKHGTVCPIDSPTTNRLKSYQQAVRYVGDVWSAPGRSDGGLPPTVGVHSVEVHHGRAPGTYNHQPMVCRAFGRWWLSWTNNPRHEHEPPGCCLWSSSADGYHWTAADTLFAPLPLPEGWRKTPDGPAAHNTTAVMHQRVGFYTYIIGKDTVLLATGYYGASLDVKDHPNDGHGLGRVARRIYPDGRLGPVHYVALNAGREPVGYAMYTRSRDRQYVAACRAMLSDPLQRMQWVEESDRGDASIPLSKPYKAFCHYALPEGTEVGLWKMGLTSVSVDGGQHWRTPAMRAEGLATSNAKIWGQRLQDGTYATLYNPGEYRWPLALSLSSNGLDYNTLSLVVGEVTPMRHGGRYKSLGPQYVRGSQWGTGDLRVVWSNNKEDIWTTRIEEPVRLRATSQASGEPAKARQLSNLREWNLRSPCLAPISIENGSLVLSDSDPFDNAIAERHLPPTAALTASFEVVCGQSNAPFIVELCDERGVVGTRLTFTASGNVEAKGGARSATLLRGYEADRRYLITIDIDCRQRQATFSLDGQVVGHRTLDAPIGTVERLSFRTGEHWHVAGTEAPADILADQASADSVAAVATFRISDVRTIDRSGEPLRVVLSTAALDAYCHQFAAEDDSGLDTEIDNSEAVGWLHRQVPLFDCPEEVFNRTWAFRWWSLRKHLVRTPTGWATTEFLVPRKYADKWNLIACATGHHITETRWLADADVSSGIARTWLRGNGGGQLTKIDAFSSWLPSAVWWAYEVTGDTASLLDLLSDLAADHERWRSTHRLPNGLYWQTDVADGMEESISGGRHVRNARPSINSYLAANAQALSAMYHLSGNEERAAWHDAEADTLRALIVKRLWNKRQQFFCTLQGDSLANVREAIGYLPWAFDLVGKDALRAEEQRAAWNQLTDPEGFGGLYGLRTAERRHPSYRTHDTGSCEWDGASWPFATSQTLTALIKARNKEQGTRNKDFDEALLPLLRQYSEQHTMRGRAYVGEYLDADDGHWLMDDRLRSKYYNHSTYADLVITGLCGIAPSAGDTLRVNPQLPATAWDHFCLDGLRYHGHWVSIVYDVDGSHYHLGRGLSVFVDGRPAATRNGLGPLNVKLTVN